MVCIGPTGTVPVRSDSSDLPRRGLWILAKSASYPPATRPHKSVSFNTKFRTTIFCEKYGIIQDVIIKQILNVLEYSWTSRFSKFDHFELD